MAKSTETYDLRADALYLIEKYKIQKSNGLYVYKQSINGEEYWFSCIQKPLNSIITYELGERYKSNYNKIEQIEKFIKSIVSNTLETTFNRTQRIFFKNGSVDFHNQFTPYTEEELDKFNPAIINEEFISINANIWKQPENKPVIDVVNKVWRNWSIDSKNEFKQDKFNYLMMFCCLAHSTWTTAQATFLKGSGANGKSQYGNNIQNLVDCKSKNEIFCKTGGFNFTDLKESFGMQPFINKLFMVCEECSKDLLTEKFKTLLTCKSMNINLKNRDSVDAPIYSTVLLCSNNKLNYNESSNAYERRIVPLNLYADFRKQEEGGTHKRLTVEEEKLFNSKLSRQYQRALMLDIMSKCFDFDNNIIPVPEEAKRNLEDMELSNNPIWNWIKEEDWITKALQDNEQGLFLYAQYVFDKYKDYYKDNHDGSDKGFQYTSATNLFNIFKDILNSKLKTKYIFDTENIIRQRVGGSQPRGFIIQAPELKPQTPEQMEAKRKYNELKIREYLTKIQNLKDENSKFDHLVSISTNNNSYNSN